MLVPLLGVLLAVSPCRSAEASDGGALTLPDLDGDGVAETYTSGTEYELAWSKSGEREEVLPFVGWEDAKYSFVSAVPVPASLVGTTAGVVEARRLLEDRLFGVTCEKPDPSLAWFLSERPALRWVDGPPVMPEHYAVYDASPAALSAARGLWKHAGEPFPGRAVWFVYRGHNHRREKPGELTLAAPRVLAERGAQALLGTAHGVLLEDRAKQRHAWLYVASGFVKLRFATIASAAFDGKRARVELDLGDSKGRVVVDLATGAWTLRTWGRDEADPDQPRGR